jgi:hypothetical protein
MGVDAHPEATRVDLVDESGAAHTQLVGEELSNLHQRRWRLVCLGLPSGLLQLGTSTDGTGITVA